MNENRWDDAGRQAKPERGLVCMYSTVQYCTVPYVPRYRYVLLAVCAGDEMVHGAEARQRERETRDRQKVSTYLFTLAWN